MNKILEAHKIQMDMVNDSFDEKQLAHDNMIDREIDDIKEEKLANKAREDTEGEHPSVHGDSPNQNMVGDHK